MACRAVTDGAHQWIYATNDSRIRAAFHREILTSPRLTEWSRRSKHNGTATHPVRLVAAFLPLECGLNFAGSSKMGLIQLLRASTVHRFQGDERSLLILDLVDSVGERNAGIFLQATALRDDGAKLFNVAFSRAQQAVVVVANLTFLDSKLPGDAILRGILYEMQRVGRVVDVQDVLAFYPIFSDMERLATPVQIAPEAMQTGLFRERDFAQVAELDIRTARTSVVVFSGFITPERVAQLGDLFRRRIAEGVQIRCVTRPARRNGTIPEQRGRAALDALSGIGVTVDLRNDIHEKALLVDGRIAWFGSLNYLSHTAKTSELMVRVENEGFATAVGRSLAIRRQSSGDAQPAPADAENPRCGDCGGWSVYIRGKFGPFFACEKGCKWKENVDRPRRRAATSK
jgi:hypothetical protein